MSLSALLEDLNPWWKDPARRVARPFPDRRDLAERIDRGLRDLRDRRALVILGPRQVGKTILLRQTADRLLDDGFPPHNLTYFDFSDDRILGEVTGDDVFVKQPAVVNEDLPRVMLLDEIRLAPRWDRWLKRIVDQGGVKVVATDSAASLLRQGTRESGQGRWDEVILEGLSFREFLGMRGVPDEEQESRASGEIEQYLTLGGFPEHVASGDLPRVRQQIRDDAVDRAVYRDLSRQVDDPGRVADLFVYLVQESGGLLNVSKRASDLEGADLRSVRKWVDLLEDTLLLRRLPPLTPTPSKRLRAHPKVYAADHGLVNAFAEEPTSDAVRARVFEAVVYRHLRDVVERRELYFYRSGGDEIDFIVRHRGRKIAVEVTSSSSFKQRKLSKLADLSRSLEMDRTVLIHGGWWAEMPGQPVRSLPLLHFLLDPASILAQE